MQEEQRLEIERQRKDTVKRKIEEEKRRIEEQNKTAEIERQRRDEEKKQKEDEIRRKIEEMQQLKKLKKVMEYDSDRYSSMFTRLNLKLIFFKVFELKTMLFADSFSHPFL